MISAFTAHPIIELRQRDKSRIETILAHGDRIFVGLNSGTLRVYRFNELVQRQPNDGGIPSTSQASAKATDLLREVDKFSTRAVDQLAIIREANIIVSLSNYYVSFHDLQKYDHIETLSRTKNASCFAVTSDIVKDADTGIPEIISRLAVAVKRRLLVWSWHECELSDDVVEVTLPESIRSITWARATKVVCGMNGGYVVVDVITRQVVDVVSPGAVGANGSGSRFGAVSTAGMGYVGLGGYTPKPLAARLSDGEILLARDINSMFIDDDGNPLEKRQIPWPSAPESVGYSYPYILALQSPTKGLLEVRNPDTLSLMQRISLPGAAQLHIPPPTVSLAHAGKGFLISSDRCVWKMAATDYDAQVQELIQHESYDEAISILNMLEDALLNNKTETLREVKMLKAESLFRKKKFRRAMELMNEDDVHAPPERVLRLFPPQIAGSLSRWADETQVDDSDKSAAKSGHGHRPNSREGTEDGSSISNVGTGFAKLFLSGHKKTALDDTSITAKKNDPEAVVEANGAQEGKENQKDEDRPLEGKDLKSAVLELNSYLVGTRTRLQGSIDPVTGKLLDRGGKQASGEEASECFFRTGRTEEKDQQLEAELRNEFRLVDTTLFRAYMFSQPSMAPFLFRLPNFCDPDVVNEALLKYDRYEELIDFFFGKKLHGQALGLLHRFGSPAKPDEAAPNLHGPDRTIQYLRNLPPSEIDLVLEYATWTLRSNPDYAMEIFTGDTENAETLPRDRVVAFLRNLDSKFERRYLEHVINELEDRNQKFHDRLVELYVKSFEQLSKGDDWDDLMTRFVMFLGDSRHIYSLSKALGMIPKDDPSFYEAHAVVLSNMNKHREALEIYVFKMKDYVKAEEYCNRVHMSRDTALKDSAVVATNDAGQSIYHILLSLYLKPPPSLQAQLEPALDLLSKHGSRLPATSTLSLIPDDLPVNRLQAYFRGRITSANSLVNESRIVAGLRKAEQIAIAARLNLGDGEASSQGGRNRHVTITDERHCFVCHKKLGGGMRIGGSVVAVLPDNTVVHYGCLNRAMSQRADNSKAAGWS